MNNFSTYKQSLDSILENSYTNKPLFKKNLSVIMGTIKYSKILREFFTLYNELESKKIEDSVISEKYVNETITYLKNNKDKLKSIKPILDKIIEDRKELCTISENPIYNKIDKIIFNENIRDIEENIVLKTKLIEHINNKKIISTTKPITPKTLSYVISKNYGKEYEDKLTETQKEILKNTILMTEDNLVSECNNIVTVTINKINELISESKEDELSARLVETKNKIKQLEPTKKTYIQVRGLLEDLN